MVERLRVGVIGCGGGPGAVGTSRGAYLGALAEVTGMMDTIAVFDVVPGHADYGAACMEQAQAYTDFDAFLSSGLDAVIIGSPLYVHVEQSVAAIERGIAVLCEVTPVSTLAEAARLVAAVEAYDGFYMLAENYHYLDHVELVKRLIDDGRFGSVHYAEGEYLHDCRELFAEADGEETWRSGLGHRGGLYCTHSLGPILYFTDDRVASVSCMRSRAGIGGETMLMQSVDGRVLKVRVDYNSPRPHNMAYYAIQGDTGSYESWRGFGDSRKVWLADAHEPSRCFPSYAGEVISQWHALEGLAEQYIPDRLAGAKKVDFSDLFEPHAAADYWMMEAFGRALVDDQPSPINVYRALDYCIPGIVAMQSLANGGAVVPVPDFHPLGD